VLKRSGDLRLFFYIPTGMHTPLQTSYKALQIPLGFFGEVGFRRMFDKHFKLESGAEGAFLKNMQAKLETEAEPPALFLLR
jgi:hypothetical protein